VALVLVREALPTLELIAHAGRVLEGEWNPYRSNGDAKRTSDGQSRWRVTRVCRRERLA